MYIWLNFENAFYKPFKISGHSSDRILQLVWILQNCFGCALKIKQLLIIYKNHYKNWNDVSVSKSFFNYMKLVKLGNQSVLLMNYLHYISYKN